MLWVSSSSVTRATDQGRSRPTNLVKRSTSRMVAGPRRFYSCVQYKVPTGNPEEPFRFRSCGEVNVLADPDLAGPLA